MPASKFARLRDRDRGLAKGYRMAVGAAALPARPRAPTPPDPAKVDAVLASVWSDVRIVKVWRPEKVGSKGFFGRCDVEVVKLGLEIREIPVCYGLAQIRMPSRPLLDEHAQRVIGANGRPRYCDQVCITHAGARQAFTRAVKRALLSEHPELALKAPESPLCAEQCGPDCGLAEAGLETT